MHAGIGSVVSVDTVIQFTIECGIYAYTVHQYLQSEKNNKQTNWKMLWQAKWNHTTFSNSTSNIKFFIEIQQKLVLMLL